LYIVRDLISLGELTHVYLMFRDLYSVNSTYQLHKYNEPIFLLSTSTDISHETVSLWCIICVLISFAVFRPSLWETLQINI